MNKRNFIKTSVFGALISLFSFKSYAADEQKVAADKTYVLGQNHFYISELNINAEKWDVIKTISNPSYSIVGTMDQLIKQELDFLLKNFVSLKYSEKDENFQKELDFLKKKYKFAELD